MEDRLCCVCNKPILTTTFTEFCGECLKSYDEVEREMLELKHHFIKCVSNLHEKGLINLQQYQLLITTFTYNYGFVNCIIGSGFGENFESQIKHNKGVKI